MVGRWLLAACLAGGFGIAAAAETPPQRVLSMNLCTDQLAMLLAAPGQLVSVSYMAGDPRASAMADQAAAHAVNYGRAEDIFLMQPDLVLAGSFTTPATVAMLRRLGKRVEVFKPAYSLDEVRGNLRRMGEVLGRGPEAEAAIARFDADLAALRTGGAPYLRAAIYAANGYSAGPDSLSGDIITAAGFVNLGTELGLGVGGRVPLEILMLAEPDLVLTARRYRGNSRGEDLLDHPGLAALKARRASGIILDREWICGTPHILRAIAQLQDARGQM